MHMVYVTLFVSYLPECDVLRCTLSGFSNVNNTGCLELQPAIFPLSQHVIRFHELPADTTQRFLQYGSWYYV